MNAMKVRSRIATGFLAAMLLPVAAGSVRSNTTSGFDPHPVAANRRFPIVTGGLFRAGVLRGAFALGDLRGMSPDRIGAEPGAAPWFRKIFELIPTDVTPPVERPAATPLEPPKIEAPGVVQNLRRADRR